MAVTINGDGTISGINVGGLPDGVVDSGTLATGIDVTKLANGTITNSELQYINSLSSNAQTQISGVGVTTACGSASFATDSTGAQAVTGVGFQPSTILFNTAGHTYVNRWSVGFAVGTTEQTFGAYVNSGTVAFGGFMFFIYETASKYINATLTSMDADGFTFTKATGGSPTAGQTQYIFWLAFK